MLSEVYSVEQCVEFSNLSLAKIKADLEMYLFHKRNNSEIPMESIEGLFRNLSATINNLSTLLENLTFQMQVEPHFALPRMIRKVDANLQLIQELNTLFIQEFMSDEQEEKIPQKDQEAL